ncbi:MAG: alcohol dehydrogenase catalytic domain-containing protein [Clostridium sp.]|nr:alcohol dehydrogenase catalytic domain-containing protein [Clostridium sp.]
MKALVYENNGSIKLTERPIPVIKDSRDAIVKVKLSSICTSDLHIINGAVPKAEKGIILGHEFVGEIVETGTKISTLKPGDRVSANCETFCGECFFCKRGFINNCINGGWKIGCSIDGCQAEYIRVPFADTGLTKIPENITYENALFTGDILSSGYFGAELCEIKEGDTIAVLGAGPVGLCAMQCARLFGAKKIIAIDINEKRLEIAKQKCKADITINPLKENCEEIVKKETNTFGADGVIEAAGSNKTFQLAWQIARPNAIVAVVAMYEENQILPLPEMYGKNLIFKTGGVDAIHCKKLLEYISEGKLNTDFLISKTIKIDEIIDGYRIFSEDKNEILKIAVENL